MESKIEIMVRNGKYGIVDTASEQVIIPFEYDNIFRLNPCVDGYMMFIFHKSGKIGAAFINSDNSYDLIAPCEYDRYCGNWNIFFYNNYEIRCYFYYNNTHKTFLDLQAIDCYEKYLFARDNDSYYILRTETGETLWCDRKYDRTRKYPCGSPCLVYMGEVNDLPSFFDCTNGGYILPGDNGDLEYRNDIGSVIKPIIVGGVNIVNIIEGSGVGVLDIRRETYEEIDCDYNEITVELKVTLKKDGHTEERIYQIPNGKFAPGDVVDHGEWN